MLFVLPIRGSNVGSTLMRTQTVERVLRNGVGVVCSIRKGMGWRIVWKVLGVRIGLVFG